MHGPDASLGAVDGEPAPARDILIVGGDGPVTPLAVTVSPTSSSASCVTPSPSPYVGSLALKPTHILHIERDTKQEMTDMCVSMITSHWTSLSSLLLPPGSWLSPIPLRPPPQLCWSSPRTAWASYFLLEHLPSSIFHTGLDRWLDHS